MGRGFESLQARFLYMVGIAQLVSAQIVALEAVGSNPITHPIILPNRYVVK